MARSNHDPSYADFVRRHRTDLVRSACLLTAGDVHTAQDLVQVALSRLYVAWPRVERRGGELAYTRRIVVNAFLDETRRSRWRREVKVAEPEDHLDPRDLDWPGADLVAGDEIRSALAALPPGMRAVIVLRHWLDLSVEDTATMLGCSPGTVKSQTARALARLRTLLPPTPSPFVDHRAPVSGPTPVPGRTS